MRMSINQFDSAAKLVTIAQVLTGKMNSKT